MFSGLTNQVSTWMGKKGEDGTEVTEEKPSSPTLEGDQDLEKKDTRYLINFYNCLFGFNLIVFLN